MEKLVFPDMLHSLKEEETLKQNIFFYDYKTETESVNNRVIFNKNIFNFIISGNKTIHTLDRSFYVDDSQFVLIRRGNCLTSEQFPENGSFNSLTLFFDSKVIQDFLLKFSHYTQTFEGDQESLNSEVCVFEKDLFIENYINSVKQLVEINASLPEELIRLKFEEIILYLLHREGVSFFRVLKSLINDSRELDFRIKMENESLNKLTIEEMAFLCNMSLSTFKRNFYTAFGVSPQKWFQNKRLQLAYESLKNKTKTPSDLYIELGYSSLSSFSVAFRNTFGVSPSKV